MSTKKKIFAMDTFCIKTKKAYKKGDEYKGKRTDLEHRFEGYKKPEKDDE